MLIPTKAQATRGWVTRPETELSRPILVRGVRSGDHEADLIHGFVYAETPDDAEQYDQQHGYAS